MVQIAAPAAFNSQLLGSLADSLSPSAIRTVIKSSHSVSLSEMSATGVGKLCRLEQLQRPKAPVQRPSEKP